MPIALLTDFGHQDHFVGAMKGAVLSLEPKAVIVDITHEIPPQDIRSGAFTLAACVDDFPKGTIFVAVVDPGVGSSRRAIAVERNGHYFVGPDNGVLSFAIQNVFGADETSTVTAVELRNEQFFRRSVSRTFHGRDIFAPIAAHLSLGVPIDKFGPSINDLVALPFPRPVKTGDRVFAEVINIDRFGNVVTNLKPSHLREPFLITLNFASIGKLLRSYSESHSEEIFAIEGSLGLIELSVRDGSAAEVLKVKVGDLVAVSY